MAGKLATELIAGDRIIVSLGAAGGDPAANRRAFAGTFNHLGQPIDERGNVMYGTPALELDAQQAAGGAPEFPTEEFNRLIREAGNKPTAATGRLLAEYNTRVEAWEKAGGQGSSVADRVRSAVLKYVETHFDVKLTAQTGNYASIDPAQVVCRPSYREGNTPATFAVAMAPVWGN